ncbi:MAG TPA: class II aldolase/adducin family protein [Phycisphaerae bacterium]|nr:class II aldolase/adducin family protein [Phycisphaerae bacterium]
MPHRSIIPDLLAFAHALGDPLNEYVIHNEGDCSAKVDDKTFLLKASGQHLLTATEDSFVPLTFEPLLALVSKKPNANRTAVNDCLRAASPPNAPMPSKEAFFHAVLLDLPGIKFIGHTHPTYVAGIMASPKAEAFATVRLFPQQVQLCGPRSLFVPYMDPGLPLAVELRYRLETYMNQYGDPPSTILLGNHGMIALGPTTTDVLAATAMTQKAARAYATAQSCGGALSLPDDHIQRLISHHHPH